MMIVLKWFFLAVVGLVMDILGAFIVPIALLCGGTRKRLPTWAWWFDNDSEPFGDVKRYAELIEAKLSGNRLRVFFLRWHWLAIRNPSNNFQYYVVGFKQKHDVEYLSFGNPNTSDQAEGGWRFVKAVNKWTRKTLAFELYVVIPYGFGRCVRIRMGWKLSHNLHPGLGRYDGSPAQLANVINPVMSFTGKTA
jgi:hypothetical protein